MKYLTLLFVFILLITNTLAIQPAHDKSFARIVAEHTTTLAQDISTTAKSATFTSAIDFAEKDKVLLGNEIMILHKINGNNIEITRAENFTTSTTHRIQDTVRNLRQIIRLSFLDHSVQANNKIVITIPEDFGNLENLITDDLAISLAMAGDIHKSIDHATRSITFATDSEFADISKAPIVITIGSKTNKLIMPVHAGNYAFQLSIRNADGVVAETDYALLPWANELKVRSKITEALVLTADEIDNQTILSVRTNVRFGYRLHVRNNDIGSSWQLADKDQLKIKNRKLETEKEVGDGERLLINNKQGMWTYLLVPSF
jgi:hypothetical protein